jgi:hypothetical protein
MRKDRVDVHRASLAHCLIREDSETWPANVEPPASYEDDLAELTIPNLDPEPPGADRANFQPAFL